jgi:ABC-2 type transport system ATP-binding protein
VAGVPATLTIDGLRRGFKDRAVVHGLTLSVEPGERIALYGPNGSGKTTVLRCVAGTLAPSSGEIHVGGHKAGSLEARRLIGASMAQERSFYLRLKGHENLLFFARLRHARERDAVRDVAQIEDELDLHEITAERVDQCSTGMVQQLAFARALIGRPSLILLDEPTRSLDRGARARIWASLDQRQAAVLLASHLDEDVERCGTRVDFPT